MSELLKIDAQKILRKNIGMMVGEQKVDFENQQRQLILKSFTEAGKKISPVWDIRDCVAVNPFFGFRGSDFLKTTKYIQAISGQSILPKKDFFLKKYKSGDITDNDLTEATKAFCRENLQTEKKPITSEQLVAFLQDEKNNEQKTQVLCMSDLYDLENMLNTTGKITKEVSKWASAYFDEGQALWKIPTEGLRFYSWWKSLCQYDKSFEEVAPGFTLLVSSLPEDPEQALEVLVKKLLKQSNFSSTELTNYFYRLLYTVLGWSSYVQKIEFEAERTGDRLKLKKVGGLVDIFVIRLAYDITLFNNSLDVALLKKAPETDESDLNLDFSYIWLNAAERVYRRSVESNVKLSPRKELSLDLEAQMVFCIDVRSEVMRRHLEQLSEKIQTIGFAGFFGLPISVKGLGHQQADQNCPVLLNSCVEVNETSCRGEMHLKKKKTTFANSKYFEKLMKNSANSGFSFVETLGFNYIGKLLVASFGKKSPHINLSSMGLSQKERKQVQFDTSGISLDEKVSMTSGALKNMGLTKNFAKFVFFFGHGSESVNNPYASALDCGACAGHNGHSNSKLLTLFLNDKNVREELKQNGIDIPPSTCFVSGWHNTTTDELVVDLPQSSGDTQISDLKEINKIMIEASQKCQQERITKLPQPLNLKSDKIHEELQQKSKDWSEVRPEWGLARNASFIIGRRSLTRGLNLEGRSFLHDYNPEEDNDLTRLELIMTAPMIVTNWINMQYYASTVGPEKFGAGNKALNNVVGGIGCVQGNGSDLLIGLTEQSVMYQNDYYHEPLRLQVFIEATISSIDQIVQKHSLVKDLIQNNWLKVISIHPESQAARYQVPFGVTLQQT